jgi:hypothetical protein
MARRAALAPTEIEWQAQVTHLAKILGWRVNHTRRSIGKGHRWTTATSIIGWPDLTLWHEQQQRILFVELKTDKGVLTPEQIDVLHSLDRTGLDTFVWRPHMLEEIRDTLSGRNPVTVRDEDQPHD